VSTKQNIFQNSTEEYRTMKITILIKLKDHKLYCLTQISI